jgi:hypothetical protein
VKAAKVAAMRRVVPVARSMFTESSKGKDGSSSQPRSQGSSIPTIVVDPGRVFGTP